MSLYTLMLMMKSVRPAAAFDFLRWISTSNHSSFSRSWMLGKLDLGTKPSSMRCLKPSIVSRNLGGGDIIIWAAFQLVSTFLKGMSLVCSRQSAAAVTSSTPAGGFFSAFSSPKSLTVRPSSAWAAATSAGSAAASLTSISAFIATTSASFLVAAEAMTLALAASSPALPFSSSSLGTIASHSAFFASTSMDLAITSSCSTDTEAAVDSSLMTPSDSFLICASVTSRRDLSIAL
mmetsp:Transcript_73037/g.145235  ORF Transcript_73037/g.145235 Transcript_73037/m.145235 type:complete len:234 (-) Transcript_73037:6625-7326(-)